MNYLKFIVILLVAGYLIASLLLYIFQEKFIFQAVQLEDDYQFEFDIPFSEQNIEMADGATINVLYFKVDSPKGFILYFHGNAGSLANWGSVASNFTSLGYDIAIMDYRGYGKSKGKRTEKALLSDAIELYEYFIQDHPEENVILYGRSLGTGIATYVASRNKPGKLLLETPYNNFTAVVQYHVPVYPAAPSLRYKFPTEQWISAVTCPIYIFHGTEDSVVPYHLGMKLYKQLDPEEDYFVTIEKGSHNNLDTFTTYRENLSMILD